MEPVTTELVTGEVKFVLCGARQTGKTVYLGTLFGQVPSVASSDAETVQYLKRVWDTIARGERPAATAGTITPLHLHYRDKIYDLPFTIPDYDGTFSQRISEVADQMPGRTDDQARQLVMQDPAYYETLAELRRHIEESSGLLFFFPYEKNTNDEALREFRNEVDTYINLIRQAYPDQKGLPIPVAIVVTKWDRSPHFRDADEDAKALDYLQSVAIYRQCYDKITTFFRTVGVFPVSAFGNTADAAQMVPKPHDVQPHRITDPLNFVLDHTFDRFGRAIAHLQEGGSLQAQFEYLSTIYNVIRFHKHENGTYGDLYDRVEAEYAQDVISQLEAARLPGPQGEVVADNAMLVETVRNPDLRKAIQAELSAGRRRRFLQWTGRVLGTVVFLTVIAGAAYAVNERRVETALFAQITGDELSEIELCEVGDQYLRRFSPEGKPWHPVVFVGLDIDGRIQDVQNEVDGVRADTDNTIARALREVDGYDTLMGRIAFIREQIAVTACRRDTEQAALLRDRLEELELLRSTRRSAAALVNSGEDWELRPCRSSQTRPATLAGPIDSLRGFEGLEEVEDLLPRLRACEQWAAQKDEVRQLLARLRQTEDPNEFRAEMARQNCRDLEPEDLDQIKQVMDRKFADYERALFADVVRDITTEQELRNVQAALEGRSATEVIPKCLGDERKYQTPANLQSRVDRLICRADVHDRALSQGIDASEFQFRSLVEPTSTPLYFECDGWYQQRSQLNVRFGSFNEEFPYSDEDGNVVGKCQGSGRNSTMKWVRPFKVRRADTEISAWLNCCEEDYRIDGRVNITDVHLFTLLRTGRLTNVPISSGPYQGNYDVSFSGRPLRETCP